MTQWKEVVGYTTMTTRRRRTTTTRGLAICIKKYLKAKRRIMETQIFHHAKIYDLQKNPCLGIRPKKANKKEKIITSSCMYFP
jgi:hypothetical protein